MPDVDGGSMSIANEPRPGLPSALGFEDLHVEESNQQFGVSTGGDRVAMVRDGHSLGFVEDQGELMAPEAPVPSFIGGS